MLGILEGIFGGVGGGTALTGGGGGGWWCDKVLLMDAVGGGGGGWDEYRWVSCMAFSTPPFFSMKS